MSYISLEERKLIETDKQNKLEDVIDMLSRQLDKPLNNISLLSNQLINSEDKESRVEISQNINEQIKFILDTLLYFKDIFGSEQKIKTFNLHDSLVFIEPLLMTKRKQFNFRLILDCPEEICISSNENSFMHAILNLCCNSAEELIKLRAQDGCIWVNVKEESDRVLIYVRDNAGGLHDGVSPEVIFQPYFTTKDINSTGVVGLYITKFIIEKVLKGTITAENCDRGMLFTISIRKD